MNDGIEYRETPFLSADVSGFRCELNWSLPNDYMADDDFVEHLAQQIGAQAVAIARRLMQDRALSLSKAALRDMTKLPEVR